MPGGSHPLADFLTGAVGGLEAGYGFREGIKGRKRQRELEDEERERIARAERQRADEYEYRTGRRWIESGTEQRTTAMEPPRFGVDQLRTGVGAGLLARPPERPPGLRSAFLAEAPELQVPQGWLSQQGPPQFRTTQHPGGYEQVGLSEAERSEQRKQQQARELAQRVGTQLAPHLGGDLTPEQVATAHEAGYLDLLAQQGRGPQNRPLQFDPKTGTIFDPTTGTVRSAAGYTPPPTPEPRELQQQVVPTAEGGYALVNRVTGQSTPVQGVQRPQTAPQRADPVVQRQIGEVNAAVSEIDNALKMLTERPRSVGLAFAAPDFITQRTDPEGVALRAAIANIGSTIVLARSGGAVSKQEFERIEPFIPKASHSPEAIRTKLEYLRDYFGRKAQALEQTGSTATSQQPVPQQPAAGLIPVDEYGRATVPLDSMGRRRPRW
jgi:hypothetical protein